MWFKNLVVHRLPTDSAIKGDALERKLAQAPLQPCSGLQMETSGWTCPHEEGLFLYQQNRQWLLALETLVGAKGASSAGELQRYQQAWDAAADRTPHGQPIELRAEDFPPAP